MGGGHLLLCPLQGCPTSCLKGGHPLVLHADEVLEHLLDPIHSLAKLLLEGRGAGRPGSQAGHTALASVNWTIEDICILQTNA